MINIKAEAIRLGVSRFWSNKNSIFEFKSFITTLAFSSLVKDFFCSKQFRTSSFTYDSSVVRTSHLFTTVDVFIQDSVLEELISFLRSKKKKHFVYRAKKVFNFKFFPFNNTLKPQQHFPILSSLPPNKTFFFKKKINFGKFFFNMDAKEKNSIENFFLYKKFSYFNLQKSFSSNFFTHSFANFKIFFDFQFFNPFSQIYPHTSAYKKTPSSFKLKINDQNFFVFGANKLLEKRILTARNKRFNKISLRQFNFAPRLHIYPILHYFFFSSTYSARYALFSFFSKLFSKFAAVNLPIHTIQIYPTFYLDTNVNAYAFYAIVRLKYRYILSHIIKPLINGIARYYKGFFILCNGRFTRAQMASTKIFRRGFINFSRSQTIIFYRIRTMPLRYGASTIHLWLHH